VQQGVLSAYGTLEDGYYVENGVFIKHVFGKKERLFAALDMKLAGKHNQETCCPA